MLQILNLPAFGSVVKGGTGNNQYNELDILADNQGTQVIEGPVPGTTQENLQVHGVWLGATGLQKLVVVGGSATAGSAVTNQVATDGQLIPNTVLEGGFGPVVTNTLTTGGGTTR